MNNVSVIIAGLGGWETLTRPCVESILRHELGIEIIIVDSDGSYPDWPNIIKTPLISYGEAINEGVKNSTGKWILAINNDVLCQGKFVEHINTLNPDAIYGRQIIEEAGHIWLGNWLALMTRDVFDRVGGFDPAFKKCGFEDADFCVRAKAMGIETQAVELPFLHLEGRTRWNDPQYHTIRQGNIEYFEDKHGFSLGNHIRVTHD